VVAIYRAIESERRDAIFRDPYARRLGGERGEAIVRSMPGGEHSAWPMIVRTAVMDEIVRRCVRAGAKTVLNLAAGSTPAPSAWTCRATALDPRRHAADGGLLPRAHGRREPRCELEYAALDLREEGTAARAVRGARRRVARCWRSPKAC
jgi:hypothetical protein